MSFYAKFEMSASRNDSRRGSGGRVSVAEDDAEDVDGGDGKGVARSSSTSLVCALCWSELGSGRFSRVVMYPDFGLWLCLLAALFCSMSGPGFFGLRFDRDFRGLWLPSLSTVDGLGVFLLPWMQGVVSGGCFPLEIELSSHVTLGAIVDSVVSACPLLSCVWLEAVLF
ncbi:hypothetical protein SUGI_0810820 [Cryptomeria japonica]|nr:hypothetical protein SUGI_0810820 [Cryptomeria japonica]